MKTISILGCGWLGFPLAVRLAQEGWQVHGSTTDASKLTLFDQQGIKSFLVQCSPEVEAVHLTEFLNSDILFFNIPFRRKLKDPRYYQDQLRAVVTAARSSTIKTIFFTGTTSIYPEDCGSVDEDFIFEARNERAQVLLDMESGLLTDDHFNAVILRLSGLYGAERRIGQFLAGKKNISNGDSPVNLIHLDDCVNIIVQLIEQSPQNQIFNLCSDQHPTRKKLYCAASEALGQLAPIFSSEASPVNKVVDNTKIKTVLNYEFIHPDPLKDVNHDNT